MSDDRVFVNSFEMALDKKKGRDERFTAAYAGVREHLAEDSPLRWLGERKPEKPNPRFWNRKCSECGKALTYQDERFSHASAPSEHYCSVPCLVANNPEAPGRRP